MKKLTFTTVMSGVLGCGLALGLVGCGQQSEHQY